MAAGAEHVADRNLLSYPGRMLRDPPVPDRELLALTLDTLPGWVAIADETGHVIYSNAAWKRFAARMGRGRKPARNGLFGFFLPKLAADIGSVIRGAHSITGEYHLAFHNLQALRLQINGIAFGSRRFAMITGSSELPGPKEDLLPGLEQTLLWSAFDQLQYVFFVLDVDEQRFLYVNEAYEQLCGRSRTLLYQNPLDFIEAIHPEDRGRVRAGLRWHLKSGATLCEEFRVVTANNDLRSMRATGRPVGRRPAEKRLLAGVVVPIAEQRTEAVGTEAGAGEKAHQRIIEAAHEFRTPLQVVLGLAEMLGPGANQADSERMDTIKSASQHLLHLANQLLDIHAGESGRVRAQARYFEPRLLLEDLLRLARALARDRPIVVQGRLAAHVPRSCAADSALLRQAILNLVSNALKFTDRGSIAISIGYQRSTAALIVHVVDTGPGIAADVLPFLFAPDPGPRRQGSQNQRGFGLGLPIVSELVQRMGGQVRVRSRTGEGTAFRLRVPAPSPRLYSLLAGVPSRSRVEPGLPGGMRILLADDNSVIRSIVRAMLMRHDLVIVESPDGAAALEHLQNGGFDAALLDMHMPQMDGIKVAHEYLRRHRGADTRTRLLALTADPFARARALAAGFDSYLIKPVRRAQLLRALQRLVEPDRWEA